TTSSDNSLSAGLYTITVKDNLGCDTVLNITITEPAALVVTINSTNITCNGTASVIITQPQPLTAVINPINVSCNLGSDGGANAVTSGGTPGYTFAWS